MPKTMKPASWPLSDRDSVGVMTKKHKKRQRMYVMGFGVFQPGDSDLVVQLDERDEPTEPTSDMRTDDLDLLMDLISGRPTGGDASEVKTSSPKKGAYKAQKGKKK